MNIRYTGGVMNVTDLTFDAQLTLIDSAQVFHWKSSSPDTFIAFVGGKRVVLRQETDGFLLENVQEGDVPFWAHYFDLNRDYAAIAASCAAYPIAQRAMNLLPGMRVLNQPAWEVLISFILSANNNVLRIRQLTEKLAASCGKEGAFPTPERLSESQESDLRAIGCGYRAPYLIKTAQLVCEGFPLETLSSLTYDEAHALLLTLPGVGDKVADCVQLFGTGHSEAFPVDIWVERLMKCWFLPEARSKKEIRTKAHEMFGMNAGIVQQSLFHCARLGLIPLE